MKKLLTLLFLIGSALYGQTPITTNTLVLPKLTARPAAPVTGAKLYDFFHAVEIRDSVGFTRIMTARDTLYFIHDADLQGVRDSLAMHDTIFIRRDGTFALTGDWSAGAYKIANTDTIQTSQINVPGTLGIEKVLNGDFASDLSNWSGANWAWSAGTALHSTGSIDSLKQTGTPAIAGETYRITYTIIGRSTGWVEPYFGGIWGGLRQADGTVTEYITATTTDYFHMRPSSTFDGAIDNVSIKKITSGTSVFETETDFRKKITIRDRINFADGLPISIGYNSLPLLKSGYYANPSSNIAIGNYVGVVNSTGHITGVGYYAGYSNTTGVLTAVGKWAGYSNTDGHATFFGNAAGFANTTAESSCFGDESGRSATDLPVSTFGYYAGQLSTKELTAFGYMAASKNASGEGLSAFGHEALLNSTGSFNTAVGYQAGRTNTTGLITAVGYRALYDNTDGKATAVGSEALTSSTSGNGVAMGYHAGYQTTTGSPVFVGYEAGYANLGSSSVAMGYQAGYSNTSGILTAIGYQAGYINSTGSLLALGYRAGHGADNYYAPQTDTYGILIGYEANRSVARATALTNYIGIGYGTLIDKSNQVKIGNSSINETNLYGKLKVGTISAATTDLDKFLVSDSDTVKYRTGTQVLSDLGLAAGGSLLPTGTEGQLLYNNNGTWTAFDGARWDDVNSRLGIGTVPFSGLSLLSDYGMGFQNHADAASRRWWVSPDQIAYGDFAIRTESSQGRSTPDVTRFYIDPSGRVVVKGTSAAGFNFYTNGTIGAATSLTAPTIKLTTSPSVNYVWKCTNVDGSGAWTSLAASETYKGVVDGDDGKVNYTATALIDGTGTAGDYYRCYDAGTYNYGSGNITMAIGDELHYNGSVWLFELGVGYTLQAMTASALGGAKLGGSLQINSEVLNINNADMSDITVSGTGSDVGKIWSINAQNSAFWAGKITDETGTDKVVLSASPSLTGTVALNGDLTMGATTDKKIDYSTSSSWHYYLAGAGNDWKLYDSDNTDFIKLFYNAGTTTKYMTLLGMTVKNDGNVTLAGSLGLTGTRVSKGWFTDIEATNAITGSITGNAATATKLTVPRSIYGNDFDGSAALTQVIASTYGGTGNGFTKFTGPLSTEKTFTLPNENATIARTDAGQTFTGDQIINGDVTLGTATDKKIKYSTSTSWNYYLAADGNNWKLYDSDNTDFIKAFYGSGTTTKHINILGMTVKNDGNVTLAGSLGLTGTRVSKGWFTDLEITNMPTVSGVPITASGLGGANKALDNLASVAINQPLTLGTSDQYALGSATKMWSDLYLGAGGIIDWNNGNVTLAHGTGELYTNAKFRNKDILDCRSSEVGKTGYGFLVNVEDADDIVVKAYDQTGHAYLPMTFGGSWGITHGGLTINADAMASTLSSTTLSIPGIMSADSLIVNHPIHIGTTDVSLNRASGNQTLTGVSIDGNAGTVTVGDETADTEVYPLFSLSSTGSLAVRSDATKLKYNSNTGTLTANAFSGVATSATTATYVKSTTTTGVLHFTGMSDLSIRQKTVRNFDDVILEAGGSYSPTGTWTLTNTVFAGTKADLSAVDSVMVKIRAYDPITWNNSKNAVSQDVFRDFEESDHPSGWEKTYKAVVTLNAAEIGNIYASPKTIVSAPGSGYAIEVITATLKWIGGSNAYSNAQLGVGTGVAGNWQNYWLEYGSVTNATRLQKSLNNDGASVSNIHDNGALTVSAGVINPSGGNGTAKVYVTYRIITL